MLWKINKVSKKELPCKDCLERVRNECKKETCKILYETSSDNCWTVDKDWEQILSEACKHE